MERETSRRLRMCFVPDGAWLTTYFAGIFEGYLVFVVCVKFDSGRMVGRIRGNELELRWRYCILREPLFFFLMFGKC